MELCISCKESSKCQQYWFKCNPQGWMAGDNYPPPNIWKAASCEITKQKLNNVK